MGDDQLLEINVLELLPYFSWKPEYFQTLIGSCKVDTMIPDGLLILASVPMFSSPRIEYIVYVCSLVGPINSLVWCEIITSS